MFPGSGGMPPGGMIPSFDNKGGFEGKPGIFPGKGFPPMGMGKPVPGFAKGKPGMGFVQGPPGFGMMGKPGMMMQPNQKGMMLPPVIGGGGPLPPVFPGSGAEGKMGQSTPAATSKAVGFFTGAKGGTDMLGRLGSGDVREGDAPQTGSSFSGPYDRAWTSGQTGTNALHAHNNPPDKHVDPNKFLFVQDYFPYWWSDQRVKNLLHYHGYGEEGDVEVKRSSVRASRKLRESNRRVTVQNRRMILHVRVTTEKSEGDAKVAAEKSEGDSAAEVFRTLKEGAHAALSPEKSKSPRRSGGRSSPGKKSPKRGANSPRRDAKEPEDPEAIKAFREELMGWLREREWNAIQEAINYGIVDDKCATMPDGEAMGLHPQNSELEKQVADLAAEKNAHINNTVKTPMPESYHDFGLNLFFLCVSMKKPIPVTTLPKLYQLHYGHPFPLNKFLRPDTSGGSVEKKIEEHYGKLLMLGNDFSDALLQPYTFSPEDVTIKKLKHLVVAAPGGTKRVEDLND